jgi:hypothetical protein
LAYFSQSELTVFNFRATLFSTYFRGGFMKKSLKTYLLLPIYILIDFSFWFVVETIKILVAYYQGDELIRKRSEAEFDHFFIATKEFPKLVLALLGTLCIDVNQMLDEGWEKLREQVGKRKSSSAFYAQGL